MAQDLLKDGRMKIRSQEAILEMTLEKIFELENSFKTVTIHEEPIEYLLQTEVPLAKAEVKETVPEEKQAPLDKTE